MSVVQDFVYLEVKFSCTGSLKPAIDYLIQQATKAMYSLLSKARKLQLSLDTLLYLFDRTVVPVLLYGCEIWGYEKCEKANTFCLKFFKTILGLKRSTNNCMVYGELGRFPLTNEINKRMVKYWAYLIVDENKKLSSLFLNCINSQNFTEFKWLKYICATLDKTGLFNIWLQKDFSSANFFEAPFFLRGMMIYEGRIGQQQFLKVLNVVYIGK